MQPENTVLLNNKSHGIPEAGTGPEGFIGGGGGGVPKIMGTCLGVPLKRDIGVP